MRRTASAALTLSLATSALTTGALALGAPTAAGAPTAPLDVMFVGNNWDGTATVVDPTTYEPITTIDTIPDRDERMAEIATSPDKLAFYLAVQAAIGEGNAQYTDDMFTTHDGRLLAVSRPSFADVVGIDLATGEIRWRFPMEGYRSDHMGVSPDGTRLLVSDSTANKVHELDIWTGEKTGEFASGDSPHENNYTADGERVFHASIGRVYTPTDRPVVRQAYDTLKGERYFQIVRTDDLSIEHRWDMGRELEEAGYPGMALRRPPDDAGAGRAVRLPAGLVLPRVDRVRHPGADLDGTTTYDGEPTVGAVTRVVDLPKRTTEPRENYVLDSAHHGMTMNAAGTTLCAAGTMDGYAAIVDRETEAYAAGRRRREALLVDQRPDGDDVLGVGQRRGQGGRHRLRDRGDRSPRSPVGDHPQRVREGVVADDVLSGRVRSGT